MASFSQRAVRRADDAADARKIIEKAVQAQGRQEKIKKLPGHVVTFKGTFHGMGDGIAMHGTVSTQGPDKQRIDIEVDAGGMKVPVIIITAGDKGWTKFGKGVKDFGEYLTRCGGLPRMQQLRQRELLLHLGK